MQLFHRTMLVALVAMVLASLAGCHLKDEFFLNPDGSGKVIHSYIARPEMEDHEVRQQLMAMHRQMPGTDGVAAHFMKRTDTDVTYGLTAYFTNFEKMQVQGSKLNLNISKNADGTVTMTLADAPTASRPASMPAASQPADMDAAVKAAQAELRQALDAPMMSDMAKCKQTNIYHLPGTVKAVNGFKKVDDRTVSIELDAGKAFAAMRKIADDPARIRKFIEIGGLRQGRPDMESPAVRKLIMKDVLGVEEPIFFTYTPDNKPTFDYAAELKKAVKQPDTAYFVANGVLPKSLLAAPKPLDAVTFNVHSVKRDPKHFFGPRIEVRVNVILPADATAVAMRSEIFSAETEDGKYAELTENGRMTLLGDQTIKGGDRVPFAFNVGLKNDEKLTKIKRLFGAVRLASFSKMSLVDAGEIEMKAGAKGSKFGLVIKEMKAMGQGDNAARQIVVDSDNTPGLGAIKFYDATGKEVLSMGSTPQKKSERSSMHFGKAAPLPEKVTVKVTIYEDYKEATVPFELKDIEIPAAEPKP